MRTKKEYIPIIAGLLFLLNVYIGFRDFIGDILDIFRSYASYKIMLLIPFILHVLFAVFLLIGKKKLLLIPVGVELFSEICWILIGIFEFGDTDFEGLIYELPYFLLLALIIMSCIGKRKILKYLWFLPAVMLFVPVVYQFTSVMPYAYYFPLEGILDVAAIGLTGYWLTVEEGFEEAVIVNGYCDMRKHVLLLILTFGIWELIWVYRMTAYLNNAENFEKRSPKNQLLLFIFIPFYSVYWYYQSAKRVDKLAEKEGVTSDTAIACLVLSLARYLISSLIGIAPPIIIQNKINKFSKEPSLPKGGGTVEDGGRIDE